MKPEIEKIHPLDKSTILSLLLKIAGGISLVYLLLVAILYFGVVAFLSQSTNSVMAKLGLVVVIVYGLLLYVLLSPLLKIYQFRIKFVYHQKVLSKKISHKVINSRKIEWMWLDWFPHKRYYIETSVGFIETDRSTFDKAMVGDSAIVHSAILGFYQYRIELL